MHDALVLLAKDPHLSEFPQRLAPMSEHAAAKLATAFLKDAIVAATSLRLDVWCTTQGDDSRIREILPPTVRVFKRNDGDYAMRLVSVSDELFSVGYRRVVIVPTDCPTIDAAYMKVAFDALIDSDAVVGPSDDGGYVLVGLTKPIPRLFLDIDMGTDKVLRQTLLRARELDLRMNIVPPRRGINSLEGLQEAIANGEMAQATHTLAAVPRLLV